MHRSMEQNRELIVKLHAYVVNYFQDEPELLSGEQCSINGTGKTRPYLTSYKINLK